jgi:hypothetical protein
MIWKNNSWFKKIICKQIINLWIDNYFMGKINKTCMHRNKYFVGI